MLLTNRAIWTIERNLDRPLSLGDLASACEVSPFHLAHAFGEATGRSVMSYVRGRRLTVAADALAGGAADILALALATGYGSHEAFSRAFRAQFGATPEAVRRAGSTALLDSVPPLDMVEEGAADIASVRIEAAEPTAFVGLAGHFGFGAMQGIPALWQRFMQHYGEIENRTRSIPVGISHNIDADGDFDYLCAADVAIGTRAPTGLTLLEVPAQTYAVFQHRGHVATIRSTYATIWNHWLPSSGRTAIDAPNLERHNPSFDTGTGLGGLEIWIPVAGGR